MLFTFKGTTTFVCLQQKSELKSFSPYFELIAPIQEANPQFTQKVDYVQFSVPGDSKRISIFSCSQCSVDMGVPKVKKMIPFIEELYTRLLEGQNLYIHCWVSFNVSFSS